MSEPSQIWVIRTEIGELRGWFYAAVETEEEARSLTESRRPGETIIGTKLVKNVERILSGSFCPVPIGDYWGPAIP
jgi:hypothetical protein